MTTGTTSRPGAPADRSGAAVRVLAVPFDDPAATALRDAQQAELAVRYGEGGGGAPLHADEVLVLLRLDVDGLPVGCGALRDVSGEHGPGTGELKRLYVRPDHRRRGLSRVLLAALEDAARAHGLRRLVLETGTRQPESMALYASAGWSATAPYGEYADHPMSRCYAKTVDGADA
ncbi:GNAT family N-acetyltransferase [Cellulomonas endophytica]|uniref:GNAT family N-acetyltransferase n=1 Tax=Cellulomonas endophytica TaxID=2494735 RepID=UPI0010136F43|nr:GNAT family N-acetyltransferase [Cellulomonas endophytica]